MDNSWIKIYRRILDWRWYKESCTLHIFLHLLLKASTVDTDYMQWQIKRGQLITSYKQLSEETGISTRSIRTALERLKQTGEISTKQATNRGTLVTICNYNKYNTQKRTTDKANDKAATKQRQSSDKAIEQEFKNYINISSPSAPAREEPADSPDALLEPEYFRQVADSSPLQNEQAAISLRITPRQFAALLRDFAVEQSAKGVTHRDLQDYRRHAFDWIRRHIQEEQKQNTENKIQQARYDKATANSNPDPQQAAAQRQSGVEALVARKLATARGPLSHNAR